MGSNKPIVADDRGAILAYMALAILALTAFTTFVVDYGVFWASRTQAQSSADAGALAGAVALAYDSATDSSPTGPAYQSAYAVAQKNLIWNATPSVDVTIIRPSLIVSCPDRSTSLCVQVNVFRDTAHGNALPIFFGTLVGLTSQDIRATATAEVGIGNATNCLQPWSVPDKWQENNFDSTFENPPDAYVAPTGLIAGTGYTVTADYRQKLVLDDAEPKPLGPGWFRLLNLTDKLGGTDLATNMATCVGTEYGIGDSLTEDTSDETPTGDTTFISGIAALIALDSSASWDGTKVVGSCVETSSCPGGVHQSPRIVDVPLFDPQIYGDTGKVKIVNILGYFIDHIGSHFEPALGRTIPDVTGYQVTKPAIYDPTKGVVSGSSAFVKTIYLVR